jgi:hypothetical protein
LAARRRLAPTVGSLQATQPDTLRHSLLNEVLYHAAVLFVNIVSHSFHHRKKLLPNTPVRHRYAKPFFAKK